ncbi:MAG: DNA polymerase III subunit delta' [Pseudomonadota bacterium]
MSEVSERPTPEERADLVGHNAAEAAFLSAFNGGRLHHAWLVTGPEGVGKATFAFRAARAVLDERAAGDASRDTLAVAPDEPGFRQIANLGHPDLLVLRRPYDEKKGRYLADLPVDEVRKLGGFFSKTAGRGGWRVAIVDTADDMNRNAANALLKVLEEPPSKGLIFVLSSAPGRLLATIRSRCRRLDLHTVDERSVTAFLEREGVASGADAERIAGLSGGRPGYALRLAGEDGAALLSAVETFFTAGLNDEPAALLTVAENAAGKPFEANWAPFIAIVADETARIARGGATGMWSPGALPVEAAQALAAAAPVARWAEAWEKLRDIAGRGDALNLDRKQIVLNMGFAVSQVCGGRTRS